MSARIAALIVAAGAGERLGSDRPKAFVELAGRPMLDWSVEALRGSGRVDAIVVALPEGAQAPDGCVGVPGGAVRSESVRNALGAAPPSDVVLVHDAARPLVTPALVVRVVGELEGSGCDGAIAAAPVADTIKLTADDRTVLETPDRSRLWAVQTPQVFRREALERALDVPSEVLAAATDDASLVERAGGTVRVVEATRENLKVTSPLDLQVARALMAERTR